MLDPTLQKKKRRFEKIRKGLMYNNEEDSSPKPPNLDDDDVDDASKATEKEMRHQAKNLEFPEHPPIPCCV